MIRSVAGCCTMMLGVALLFACSRTDAETEPCCAEDEVAALPLPGESVYQLDHAFRDQVAAARTLRDFRGKPTLVAMIFTHCSFSCPAIIADIKRVVAATAAQPDLQVVLVSMDTKRDKPAVLAEFAKQHALGADRFSLLHGDADAVAEVAAVLGVRFSEVDGGDFSHSNQVALLDEDGQIVHRMQGLAADIEPLVAAVAALQ